MPILCMFGLHILWWFLNGLIENIDRKKFDRMTDNDLHVKLKPVVKVLLIN